MTYYLHNNQLFRIDRMPPDDDFHWALCDCDGCGDLRKEWHSFNIYLSTLTPIPHELKGESRIVPEDQIDWKYEYEVDGQWHICTEKRFFDAFNGNKRRVAVPIEAKEQESATPQQQPAKETMLEQLADLLKKYDVRKYVNVNDSGYSQVERDIVDLFASQHGEQETENKWMEAGLRLVAELYKKHRFILKNLDVANEDKNIFLYRLGISTEHMDNH